MSAVAGLAGPCSEFPAGTNPKHQVALIDEKQFSRRYRIDAHLHSSQGSFDDFVAVKHNHLLD
jgi:hypothetical protein